MDLPTKEQIKAIADIGALTALKEDVDDAIIAVETQLQFRDDDQDWRTRATSALFYQRQCRRALENRIRELRDIDTKGETNVRPESDNSPLTNEALRNLPVVDLEAVKSVEEANRAIERLQAIIDAVETDRNNEIGLVAGERDEAFCAETKALVRRLNYLRGEVASRRGRIRKQETIRATHERDAIRERLFIEVARATLPRETFFALWEAVDRRFIQDGLERAA